MAEWEDEYEVKDEELVDFEGSDYGFDSDDERLEEEVTAVERNGNSNHKRSETEQAMAAPAPAAMEGNNKTLEKKEKENEEKENKKMGALKLQNQGKEAEKSGAGLERGGHHNNKQDDGKRDATVAPVLKSSVALLEGEGKGVGLSRHRKHHKADLEDGELDDAAMPEGSDPEAEANAGGDDNDEIEHHERKRRKSRFAAERSSEDKDKNKYPDALALAQFRQSRGQGSSRTNLDHSSNASRVARSMTAVGFNSPNMVVGGAGIMGPGRPPVSLEFTHIPFNCQGLPGPLGWMPTTGRPEMQNHIMEAMAAQEYILRSHQHMMQLAHANVRGPVRPSIGGPPTRPFMGLDLVEPRVPVGPHQIMQLQVNQAPDAGTAMNFPGRMEAARRMLQPVFGAGPGAGGMMNQFANRPGASPGIGAVRQQGVWASPPLGGQMQQLPIGRARGQVRGRGQMIGPLWGDFQAQGISTGIPAHPGGIGQGVAINVGPAFGPGGMMDMGSPKRQSSIPQMMRGNSIDTNREMSSNMTREVHHGEVDGLRRADEGNKGVGTSNGLVPHGFWSANPGVAPTDIKRHRESVQHRQKSFSHPVPGPVTAPIRHINNGKGPNVGTAGNNHLIQLGGQLQKSRVLIVSGLLENTSMAVVVEAFEKQGKITDFKKEERGDAFAITFASVQEATSAKRSLHRTILAGQQITVEYAMPQD